MKRAVLIAGAALLALPAGSAWVGSGQAAAAQQAFDVAMTAAEEVPTPGPAGATGAVQITVDPTGGKLCYSGFSYDGPGTPNAAHIHKGPKGTPGPVTVDIAQMLDGKDGCVSGEAATLQAIIDDPAGHYVNIHTPEHKPGAVRGQVG